MPLTANLIAILNETQGRISKVTPDDMKTKKGDKKDGLTRYGSEKKETITRYANTQKKEMDLVTPNTPASTTKLAMDPQDKSE